MIINLLLAETLNQEVETALLWEVSHGFDLPLVIGEQFICKMSGKKFQSASYNDCLQFILTTLYEEGHTFAKNIYLTLINKLDALQKCKLSFHGFTCETRTWRFHEYKNCFVGREAVDWLVDNKLCGDRAQAVELGNVWIKRGWIQHVTNEQKHFSDSTLFYKFSNSVALMRSQSEKGNHSKAMSLILDREELQKGNHLKQFSKTYDFSDFYGSMPTNNPSPLRLNGASHSNISDIKFAESLSPQTVRKRSTTMPTVNYNSHQ